MTQRQGQGVFVIFLRIIHVFYISSAPFIPGLQVFPRGFESADESIPVRSEQGDQSVDIFRLSCPAGGDPQDAMLFIRILPKSKFDLFG